MTEKFLLFLLSDKEFSNFHSDFRLKGKKRKFYNKNFVL